jgi:hypothetical protein
MDESEIASRALCYSLSALRDHFDFTSPTVCLSVVPVEHLRFSLA